VNARRAQAVLLSSYFVTAAEYEARPLACVLKAGDYVKQDLQNSAEEADGLSRAELLALRPQERGAALEDRLRRHVARVLQMPWQQLDPSEPLGSYGLGSLNAVQMIASIEDGLGVTLPTTAAFNYPSVSELALHLGRLMEFTVDAGVVEHTEVMIPAAHALEDEGLIGLLDTVERTPISDMQRMVADKRAGKT
jgi:acyl carrier protein